MMSQARMERKIIALEAQVDRLEVEIKKLMRWKLSLVHTL